MVKEKSKIKKEVTLESVATTVEDLAVSLKSLDAKFDKKFEILVSNLERLHYKIDEVDGRLGAKIDGVESRLSVRIDGLENGFKGLSARIDDLDLKIMQSFTISKERIEDLRIDLTERIDSIDSKLSARMAIA